MGIFRALAFISFLCIIGALEEPRCGVQGGGTLCPNRKCCSQNGSCGIGAAWCCEGCQSQCDCRVGFIVDKNIFDEMLPHRSTSPCVGSFYTHSNFLEATSSFREFGNTGDLATRKREIAAFFAHTSHATTGGWDGAPNGRYSWGYCWIREGMTIDERLMPNYCVPDDRYPCTPEKKYYGRGPMQLSYNYNYGRVGNALYENLLKNPHLVENNSYVSFSTALWLWMTPQSPVEPSCHDVMTGKWKPTRQDIEAGRFPGFGLTTNIINGREECGFPIVNEKAKDRLGFYLRYCALLGVDPGSKIDCSTMRPYILSSTNPTIKNNASLYAI